MQHNEQADLQELIAHHWFPNTSRGTMSRDEHRSVNHRLRMTRRVTLVSRSPLEDQGLKLRILSLEVGQCPSIGRQVMDVD